MQKVGPSCFNEQDKVCHMLQLYRQISRVNQMMYLSLVKDVHRGQKLTIDFFKNFESTILVVTFSISRKKVCLPWFPGGHFLRGLMTKS